MRRRAAHRPVLVLAAALLTAGAALPAPPPGAPALAWHPVAHSALIAVDGVAADRTLTLRVRAAGATPLGPVQLSARAADRTLPVSQQADGTWLVTLAAANVPAPASLELTVTHDGIRELLSGPVPAPAGGSATQRSAPSAPGGLFGVHKQLAWWILNIAIVLIAAIAISRRMS